MVRARKKSEYAGTSSKKRVKMDAFHTGKTEVEVFVVKKEVVPFLRYKNGTAYDDFHYETLLKLSNGETIKSYSKELFSAVVEGKIAMVKASFCKMPNGQFLITV